MRLTVTLTSTPVYVCVQRVDGGRWQAWWRVTVNRRGRR